MKFKKEEIFTIPNILTYIRILCVPFFLWMMFAKNIPHNLMIAFGLFIFASVTDLLDGSIARKYNMTSDIGKVLDPFADKLLQISAIVSLTIIGNIHYAFPVILVSKELYMIIAAGLLVKLVPSDVNIEANVWGKLAALFNAIGLILSFFHNYEGAKNLYYIDWTFLGIGCLLAIVAAINYTIQVGKEVLAGIEKRKKSKEESKNANLEDEESNSDDE